MIINKFLTQKGWRVVSHSLLAVSGLGFLYLLSGMVIEKTLSLWVLGFAITISLWFVALGTMLAKAEMSDWR
jgi:hypothetical protein